MRAPHRAALVLAVFATLAPLAPPAARAAADPDAPESRVGVMLAVMCGASARAALTLPVPYAGLAFVSCMGMLIDAATSPDNAPATGQGKP